VQGIAHDVELIFQRCAPFFQELQISPDFDPLASHTVVFCFGGLQGGRQVFHLFQFLLKLGQFAPFLLELLLDCFDLLLVSFGRSCLTCTCCLVHFTLFRFFLLLQTGQFRPLIQPLFSGCF